MKVHINGDAREMGAGVTVAALVAEVVESSMGIAVAVNEELVPRSLWCDVELRADDRIEILTATQGG